MSADRVEAFLEAEEQATNLITQLQRLKAEMSSYQDAQETLDKAVDHLAPLVEQMTSAAETLAALSNTIRENGTLELVARSEAIEQLIAESRSETRSLHESYHKQLVEELQSYLAQLREEEISLQEKHLGRTSDKIETEITRAISEVVSAQEQRDRAITESNERMMSQIQSLQGWTMRGFAVMSVLLLLLFALAMFA